MDYCCVIKIRGIKRAFYKKMSLMNKRVVIVIIIFVIVFWFTKTIIIITTKKNKFQDVPILVRCNAI